MIDHVEMLLLSVSYIGGKVGLSLLNYFIVKSKATFSFSIVRTAWHLQ